MPRIVNKRLRRKYKDKTCFDITLFSDENIRQLKEFLTSIASADGNISDEEQAFIDTFAS